MPLPVEHTLVEFLLTKSSIEMLSRRTEAGVALF